MAKAVDGVYDADPRTNPDATLFTEITHREVLDKELKVADATAFSLCMDNKMPILVFNLLQQGNIARAVAGDRIVLMSNGDFGGLPQTLPQQLQAAHAAGIL